MPTEDERYQDLSGRSVEDRPKQTIKPRDAVIRVRRCSLSELSLLLFRCPGGQKLQFLLVCAKHRLPEPMGWHSRPRASLFRKESQLSVTIVASGSLHQGLAISEVHMHAVGGYIGRPRRWCNAICDLSRLPVPDGLEGALCLDLLDLTAAAYLAQIAVRRRSAEDGTRHIKLVMPVRCARFWLPLSDDLAHLLYALTGNSFSLFFMGESRQTEDRSIGLSPRDEASAVCLLSGGVDSLAAAVKLAGEGRRCRFVVHLEHNSVVGQAQQHVVRLLANAWPDLNTCSVVSLLVQSYQDSSQCPVEPRLAGRFQLTRLLFVIALGAVAALGDGAAEVYLGGNGALTAVERLTHAHNATRRSCGVHPMVLAAFNSLMDMLGWNIQIVNPFVCQTKSELISSILLPMLSSQDIQRTVSCSAPSYNCGHCGTCMSCLLRRIAMLENGLPKETHANDVLGNPSAFVGTQAYRTLVDLLTFAYRVLSTEKMCLAAEYPSLLDMIGGGTSLPDVTLMLRKQAEETFCVVREHFPHAAALIERV